jgi:hypothetical protein
LYSFRHQIIKLEVLDAGLPKLSKLLAPIKPKYLRYPPLLLLGGSQRQPSPRHLWSKLSILHLCNCGLTRLDSSLHLTPHLIELDVSHNDLQHIIHLYHSLALTTLNISYNRLRVLSNISLVIPHIRRLNLSHNSIESLDGLDKLYSLERIDLSYNKINDFSEVAVLVRLQCLSHIYLTGNPIGNKNNSRLHIFTQFLHEASLNGRLLPILDDVPLTREEMATLQSSIFLPPQVVSGSDPTTATATAEATSFEHSFQSSTLLIGGTLLKTDDIPIHELDKIFSSESRKYRTDSPISGLIITASTSPPKELSTSLPSSSSPYVTLSRERIQNYCNLRSLKRRRKYVIRRIQQGEDQPVTPVDVAHSVMRATSVGSMRHSNETLLFSDGGIHLLEFEDFEGEDTEQLSPSPQRGTVVSRSTTSGESNGPSAGVTGTSLARKSIDSLGSSIDNSGSQNGSVRSTSNNSSQLRDAMESKSIDSNSVDHLAPRTISYLSDEVPDLSILMQQMAKVSQNNHQNVTTPSHSYSLADQQNSLTSQSDGNHVKVLMDLMNEEDPSSSHGGDGLDKSSQEESLEKSLSPESEHNSSQQATGKRTRQGRWGTTKPPLNVSESKSFSRPSASSSHHPTPSHRSNSPPGFGSVHSENWETKHRCSNQDTQTEVSSVYSGEDPLSYQANNVPTTGQIAHMFTRASQEEAKRFASIANQHYLSTSAYNTPVQSYTGSLEYEYLLVSENLEKYFMEQVFGNARPSREAPYMRREHRETTRTDSNDSVSQSREPVWRNYGYSLDSDNPLEILYVNIPYRPETLVSVFRVKVLDLSDLDQRRGTSVREEEDEALAIPQPLLFVLTDINLYVIVDNFFTNAIFADAPLPVLRRIHPIDSLRSCIVYFGFQRCVFQFRDDDINPLHRKKYDLLVPDTTITTTTTGGGQRQATTSYMIVTNDKALTSPLITTLPTVANLLRQERNLPKVFRDNSDSQFLDEVTRLIRTDTSTAETDIVYSQMIYQLWTNRPGVLVPRTLIITPMMLLLCHEDITTIRVRLRLIDSVRLTNISRVKSESDPLKLTIIMKPEGAMSFTKRKWRLMADSANMIMKVRDEIRKTCQDAKVSSDW